MRSSVALITLAAVFSIACHHAPTAPSTTAVTTITAPVARTGPVIVVTPVSPANGVVVPATDPDLYSLVTFVVQNASATAAAATVDVLQATTDPTFAQVSNTVTFPESPGAQTTIPIEQFRVGQRYYWRVRAASGDATGAYSKVFSFTVGSWSQPTTIDAPTILQPFQVFPQNQAPLLAVRVLSRPGMTGHVQFEYDKDRSFANRSFCGPFVQLGGPIMDPNCPGGPPQLAPGTYYWRARANDSYTWGPYSDVGTYVIVPESLAAPTIVGPLTGATHSRPTLTVANVAHAPNAPVRYRFRVLTSSVNETGLDLASLTVASGEVAEGTGQTSWQVPVDLVVGQQYYWDAQAIDPSSGAAGALMRTSSFTVYTARVHLYALDIQLPTSCRLTNHYEFIGTSADMIGAPHFQFTPNIGGTFTTDLMSSGAAVSGTFSGVIGQNDLYSMTALDGSTAAASVTGALMADGSMGGVVFGTFHESHPYSGPLGACSDPGIAWSIGLRDQ